MEIVNNFVPAINNVFAVSTQTALAASTNRDREQTQIRIRKVVPRAILVALVDLIALVAQIVNVAVIRLNVVIVLKETAIVVIIVPVVLIANAVPSLWPMEHVNVIKIVFVDLGVNAQIIVVVVQKIKRLFVQSRAIKIIKDNRSIALVDLNVVVAQNAVVDLNANARQ